MEQRMKEHTEKKPTVLYTQLIGYIKEDTIKEVVKDINRANNEADIESVQLTMISEGGNLYFTFALYDCIKASKKPVDIVVSGLCASAAVTILQAGRKRISHLHTTFMIHPSNMVMDKNSFPNFLEIVEQAKVNDELNIQLIIKRCGMSKEEYMKMYNPRKYLTPEQALHFGPHGLIDIIQ